MICGFKPMNECIMLYSDVFTSGNKYISVYRLQITVIREAERNGMRVVLVNMISFDSLCVSESILISRKYYLLDDHAREDYMMMIESNDDDGS